MGTRINAILKHNVDTSSQADICPHCGNTMQFVGPFTFDPLALTMTLRNGWWTHLSHTEMQVMRRIAQAYPFPVSRDKLFEETWGERDVSNKTGLMATTISRIRQRIKKGPLAIVGLHGSYLLRIFE